MNQITYKEQFDRITIAYIKGEINPYSRCRCFCGNMFNNNHNWCSPFYFLAEVRDIENIFLITVRDETIGNVCSKFADKGEMVDGKFVSYTDEIRASITNHPNYETALFNAMSNALDLLKQIHISKGEIIDETSVFVKRNLEKVTA